MSRRTSATSGHALFRRRTLLFSLAGLAALGSSLVVYAAAARPKPVHPAQPSTPSANVSTPGHATAIGQRDGFGSAPTPTPSPTQTPVTPAYATSCPLPEYPRPSCTGVRPGTRLSAVSVNRDRDYVVTRDRTVIDRKHIPGAIIVKAEKVVIRNSQVDGGIFNDVDGGGSFTVMDTTVGKAGECVPSYAIGHERYTALRVHIRGFDDGFRAGGPNVTIRDSFVKTCGLSDSHGDGIQDYPATQRLVLEHNTFDMCGEWTTVPTSAGQCDVPGHNSPVFVHSSISDGGGSTDVRIANNLALGGVFTFYLEPGYGTWEVVGNRAVNKTWDYRAYETEGHCGRVATWRDNRIVEIDANYRVTSTVSIVPC